MAFSLETVRGMAKTDALSRLKPDLDKIVTNTTSEVWSAFENKKILIIGGTGFFGTWLVLALVHANRALKLGLEVSILSRNPENFSQRLPRLHETHTLKLVKGDIRNCTFPKDDFSFVVHAATPADEQLNQQNPELMQEIITSGTKRVLDFATRLNKPRLLFTSSGAVYGKLGREKIYVTEEDRLPDTGVSDNLSAYARGKQSAEALCLDYYNRHGLASLIARCFTFIGPYLPLDAHFAAGNFLRDGLSGNTIMINGDGTPVRSYLYSSDLVVWLLTILVKGLPIRPYNVGSEEAVSVAELAEMVSKHFGVGVRIAKRAVPSQQRDIYVPSTERARKELNLAAIVSAKEAIERTVSWLKG